MLWGVSNNGYNSTGRGKKRRHRHRRQPTDDRRQILHFFPTPPKSMRAMSSSSSLPIPPLGNRLRAIQEGCPKLRRADSGLGQELQQLEQRAQKPHSLRGEHLPPTRRRVGTIRGGTPITHHGSKIILRHPIVLSTKRLSLSSFPSSDLLGRTLPTHLDLKGGGEAAAGTRWPVEES